MARGKAAEVGKQKGMIRIGLVLLLVAIVTSVMFAYHNRPGVNLMPATSDRAEWTWDRQGQASGEFTIDSGVVRADTFAVDGTDWHASVVHRGPLLDANCKYHVSFAAKADSARRIALDANSAGYHGKWESIGLNAAFSVGTEWATYEAVFTPVESGIGHPVNLPIFHIGDRVGRLWIKDVVVEKTR
jgi:hypothetical protein